jgi:hypothetical protein
MQCFEVEGCGQFPVLAVPSYHSQVGFGRPSTFANVDEVPQRQTSSRDPPTSLHALRSEVLPGAHIFFISSTPADDGMILLFVQSHGPSFT